MNDGTPVSTHCCPARLGISCFRCRFKHTNQVRGGEFLLPCGVVARPTRQHHQQTGNRRGRIRRLHFLRATAMVARPRLMSCIRFYAILSNATMISGRQPGGLLAISHCRSTPDSAFPRCNGMGRCGTPGAPCPMPLHRWAGTLSLDEGRAQVTVSYPPLSTRRHDFEKT
jgi:hypothetical protein